MTHYKEKIHNSNIRTNVCMPIRGLIEKFMRFLYNLKIMPSSIDTYTVPFK